MSSNRSMVVVVILGALAFAIAAQGQPPKSNPTGSNAVSNSENSTDEKSPSTKSHAEILAARRLDLIKRHIAAAVIQSDEAAFPTAFAPKPIFRYSDPARGYVGAAVWKLGEEGRPKAIVSTELIRSTAAGSQMAHEYTSLTTTRFSMKLDNMLWTPGGTNYEFKPIPKAREPEQTPQRRLLQIRELAKRFSGYEVNKGERCELRLLPQPIDRYTPSRVDRADGAIFFLTFGTNPEVMLLIESDGTHWTYAAGRMTGFDDVALLLDEDTIAWQGAPLQSGNAAPHTGSSSVVEIPGIAADGREVEE